MKTSVALCTYNGERFIIEQLQSIADGTVKPDEIVVCDDQSTDDTQYLIETFSASSKLLIRFYRNEERLGSTKNFEKALALCDNEIIFLCDQDDVWRKDRIERSLSEFEKNAAIGGVFTDAELVSEDLKPLGKRMFAYLGVRHFITRYHRDLFGPLLFKPFVTGATLAIRRDLLQRIMPFPPSRFFIHDGWLALTIAGITKLQVIDEPLIAYRQHSSQQVGTMLSGIPVAPAARNAAICYPLTRHLFAEFYDELRQLFMHLDLRPEAAALIQDAVRHNTLRLSLGSKNVMRPFAIIKEILSGRYHRYSTGFQSAVKDMIYPQ